MWNEEESKSLAKKLCAMAKNNEISSSKVEALIFLALNEAWNNGYQVGADNTRVLIPSSKGGW